MLGDFYAILWPLEELAEMNKAYEVSDYAPGLFLIGSDGGGEAIAFDTRSTARPIVSVPFVGMDLKLASPAASEFKIIIGSLDRSSRSAADDRQQARREDLAKEIFEIKPVILGGSPTDSSNKILLTRKEHIELVRFWNGIIREKRS